MKSTIKIDYDANTGGPVILIKWEDSDDVRDKLVKVFIEKMGYDSNWCYLSFDHSELDTKTKRCSISPIGDDKLQDLQALVTSRLDNRRTSNGLEDILHDAKPPKKSTIMKKMDPFDVHIDSVLKVVPHKHLINDEVEIKTPSREPSSNRPICRGDEVYFIKEIGLSPIRGIVIDTREIETPYGSIKYKLTELDGTVRDVVADNIYTIQEYDYIEERYGKVFDNIPSNQVSVTKFNITLA